MPRRVQDIVPNSRRSIREIPVEKAVEIEKEYKVPRSKHVFKEKQDIIEGKFDGQSILLKRLPVTPPTINHPHKIRKSKKRSKSLFIIIGTLIIASLAYFSSIYFAKATFTIIPKIVPVEVSGTYVVPVNIGENDPSLHYKIITVDQKLSITVPAENGNTIQTKATGKITIYNTYSKEPQRLIAGTRLANDSGKIYRLTGSISVPGFTESGGKKTPGSITVTVEADQPGSSYNISPSSSISDFKIVAYKGTPRYDGFYARIASEISGGFSGTRKTVDKSILASTTVHLEKTLSETMTERIKSSIPEDYIVYDQAYIKSFTTPDVGGDQNGYADISIGGTIHAITINKKLLAERLAGEKAISSFGQFDYEPVGLEDLNFSISNQKDFSPLSKNDLIFKVSGSIKLVSVIPVDEIKQKLVGIPLKETTNIFRLYSNIIDSKSSGEMMPPWAKVPSNPDKIYVVVEKTK